MALLETVISVEVGIVYLQKPFIRNRNITHSAFNFTFFPFIFIVYVQPCGL